MYEQHLGKKGIRVLYELSYFAKEETMDSTDSALDEIVTSFLHEFLYVHATF